MNSLPDNELLNKDQNERTSHEGEKSGFQPNPTILEALQANSLRIEALRKQIKDLQSKKKKLKHAYSSLVGELERTAFAKAMRQTKAPPGGAETSNSFTAAEEEFMVDEEDGDNYHLPGPLFLRKGFKPELILRNLG